jgi:hypothetical protein
MGGVGVTVRVETESVAKTFISPTNPIQESMTGFIAGQIRRRVFHHFQDNDERNGRDAGNRYEVRMEEEERPRRKISVTSWFVCLCPNWEIFSRSQSPASSVHSFNLSSINQG